MRRSREEGLLRAKHMPTETNAVSGKTWVILGLLAVCIGAGIFFIINAGQATQNTQDQIPVPAKPLTAEQKYDVLETLGGGTATGTSMAATTTVAEEKVKQEIIKNVSATSASSTQSASEKLDTLQSLQR